MDEKKVNEFIEALIKDTLFERVEWVYVDSLADDITQTAGVFPPELSGTEVSEVDYHRAYACQTNAGALYLLYRVVESEDEDAPYEGFELFLHPSPYNLSNYFLLLNQSPQLYRLENAIRNKISSSLRPLIRDEDYYLDLYLRARQGRRSEDV